jgi:hypothetical protein
MCGSSAVPKTRNQFMLKNVEILFLRITGLVRGARRPAEAGDQHPARSGPQCYRAQVIRDERVPSSSRKPTGVSDGAGTPLQPGPLSASGEACRSMRGGSGRRASPHHRLVPQSADPHLRRPSVSASHAPPRNPVECGNFKATVFQSYDSPARCLARNFSCADRSVTCTPIS